MTKFQIKRILKKVKAPDIDIPEIAPLPRKRTRLKPVLATAALALVIVGTSVVGIKGNIFKGKLLFFNQDLRDFATSLQNRDVNTHISAEGLRALK